MSEQSVPKDARASTLGGVPRRRSQEEEAWRRFNDASRGYYLLVDTDCHPERLEKASRWMDEWAEKLS